MKFIKLILNIISWGVMAVFLVMGLYILSSNYQIFGGYRSFLVQSGSMEPAIMTGDIIVIKSQSSYILNDVVSFNTENRIVTHRIVSKEFKPDGVQYSTKGDANRSQDFDTITLSQIIGKVVFVIPKLGFLVAFSKSLPGFLLLICIPTVLFLIDELLKMKNVKS